jgi:Plasmid recombination enzyme
MRKHSQLLRIAKLKGANKIETAAKHNLREIAAEIGDYGNINGRRSIQNYILCGANTAAEVASDTQSLMDEAGIKKPRKDAVLALEILISLRLNSTIDTKSFFSDSLAWAKGYFRAPVVSAVAHFDENAPHCHILIVPLVNGRMNGSRLMGYKKKLHSMQLDFNRKVGEHHGLTYQAHTKRQEASILHTACQTILEAIKAHPERLNEPALSDALMDAFSFNSDDLVLALEEKTLDINPIGFDVLQTSQQETTHIGFANKLTAGNNQSISSVGFQDQGIDKPKIERHKLQNEAPGKLLQRRKPTIQIPQSWLVVFGRS